MPEERIICCRCRETMEFGDTYFALGDSVYCPDCWEAFAASIRRYVGDVIDRI